MSERSSQPLDPAALSAAFQQNWKSLTSYIGKFQRWELPDRDLVIQQLEMNPSHQPGFFNDSNNRIVQRTVPSTIPRKFSKEASFADLIVRSTLDNVISDLENQIVNGEEENGCFQGLLSYSDATTLERNGHGVLQFCASAVKEYLSQHKNNGLEDSSNGSPSPTEHVIMLPREEKLKLTDQKKLGGLRILSSDFLPEGHGLIFAPSDLQLLIDPHLEWEIDEERPRYPIVVRYHAGMATRQPEPLVLRVNY